MGSNSTYGILMTALAIALTVAMRWRSSEVLLRGSRLRRVQRLRLDKGRQGAPFECVHSRVVEEAESLVRAYAQVLEPLYLLPEEDPMRLVGDRSTASGSASSAKER
ncbi:hypothetical protein ACFYPT_40480 [Streptomyces sp. NPDC005529]|uniref:hypothetical protein n=1 Tax=unclassified Streptomyces TaxID=2593676 RepID=UPI0033A0EF97